MMKRHKTIEDTFENKHMLIIPLAENNLHGRYSLNAKQMGKMRYKW